SLVSRGDRLRWQPGFAPTPASEAELGRATSTQSASMCQADSCIPPVVRDRICGCLPAAGTNATFNRQDTGTSRWQLTRLNVTSSPARQKKGRAPTGSGPLPPKATPPACPQLEKADAASLPIRWSTPAKLV